jgi:hypothetical protein
VITSDAGWVASPTRRTVGAADVGRALKIEGHRRVSRTRIRAAGLSRMRDASTRLSESVGRRPCL